ncbi:hypothetical protein J2X54_003297 [Duganella sp. 3397]|uniref:hypothetical protein n=1 Tax=Duganella sp. 3397 TaxID=2817732 RepID=UPI0028554C8A|nr:hypothetical protein [Duganella sp. 3397]MDR7050810.1 hypothetical protein [Duganella sp. 3397]
MKKIYRIDLIRRAVASSDGVLLDCLIAQLVDAERTKEILRVKDYGTTGTSASAIAAQVPNAPRKD